MKTLPMPEAARTLVKSPPELWAEVSDPDSLARHLGGVGEIRITRLEPESTVAWEGTRIRGTVDLAPAGWGTKVTVSAEEIAAVEPPAEIEVEPQAADELEAPEPEPESELVIAKQSRWSRWFRRKPEPAAEPEPEAPAAPVAVEPEPQPEPDPTPDTAAVLEDMLGSLGSAHHRPFSR